MHIPVTLVKYRVTSVFTTQEVYNYTTPQSVINRDRSAVQEQRNKKHYDINLIDRPPAQFLKKKKSRIFLLNYPWKRYMSRVPLEAIPSLLQRIERPPQR
jgi:hypothetical protein